MNRFKAIAHDLQQLQSLRHGKSADEPSERQKQSILRAGSRLAPARKSAAIISKQ